MLDYQYNQANQRRRIDNGDGTHWAIEYDDLGQVVSGKKYWPDGSAVPGQQFEYDFDDIGNRVVHRYGGDATGQSSKLREVSYTANSLNQYTAKANVSVVDLLGLATEGSVVTVGGSTNGVYRRGEYFHRAVTNTANTWPSLTNVVSKSGTSVTNIGSIFIPPTPEAFTHDADGNLTQDGRWDYTWNAKNRLIQMESKSGFPTGSKRKLEYEYDWQGRRIKKVSHSAWNGSSYFTVVTTKFIYDGWNLLAELDTSNNVVRSYVWGTDLSGTMQGAGGVGGLLFVKESDGTPHFVAYDGNGNVMGLVKGTDGTRTATYEYDPFGQPLRATGTMALANPMRFSTKFADNETGLLYYGYRYYSPSAGRWLSRDPIEEEGGLNLYGFVQNTPGDDWDWLGLCGCTCKSVSVTFDPGGKRPKAKFYPLHDLFGTFYRYGFIIKIEWTVDGPPKYCKYFVNEAAGGVTGETPKGKVAPSDGTFGNWVEVGKVFLDPLGIPANAGVGKYKIKVDMTQQYKCRSSDGTEVTDSKRIKISDSEKWKGPPQPPKNK